MCCDDYRFAIERKREIALYHHCQLERILQAHPDADLPSIEAQAHFEGLLASTTAVGDQLAAALYNCLGLGDKRSGLHSTFKETKGSEAHEALGLDVVEEVWYRPATKDVREVRRLATHFYYDKPSHGTYFYVEDVNRSDVERDLISYAKTALSVCEELAAAASDTLNRLHEHLT